MDGRTVLIILLVLVVVGSLVTGKIPLKTKGVQGSFDLSFVYSASDGNVTEVSDVTVTPDIGPAEAWFKSGFTAVLKLDAGDDIDHDINDVNVTIVLKVDNQSKTFHSTSLGDKKISFEAWGLESGEHTVNLDIYVKVVRDNSTIADTVYTKSYTVTVP